MVKKKDKDMEDLPHLHEEKEKKAFVDVTSTESDLKGFLGAFEVFLRKYKGVAFIFAMVPAAIAYIFSLSISLTPGYLIITKTYAMTSALSSPVHAFLMALSLVMSYLAYGLVLIFVVPFFNKLMPLKIKPWRGNWYSVHTIPWYYHNALIQLVRYTILDFITPTPLNVMFYRMMGMKIGKGCIINTSNISDACLIELEDYVTIGGSATIFGHYAQGGFLVLAPVKIKRGATIGLKASIMGDVIVGEKVTVKPHSILLPKTRLNKGDPQ
ncbi:transferase hexapeptide repeat protein [Bacteriovorax sp. DB6_IX]|uniref:transferase hexapeptide repeat protein n=1 Tax=Bacteriovorax sp. DB6_IX TaxID=1353530 RepID=UPI00038A5073|nr:transferase hexapeptide repeat protein [Bacteriovorax sp. DB6_IX]EQC52674.1 transferase hexapeptide repeat protein [Bacteriovorax sp. DB6_IX]